MDAEGYRAKARETRERAEAMRDVRVRSAMLMIAEQYLKLAERAETEARGAKGS